jgi:hypothetical protein
LEQVAKMTSAIDDPPDIDDMLDFSDLFDDDVDEWQPAVFSIEMYWSDPEIADTRPRMSCQQICDRGDKCVIGVWIMKVYAVDWGVLGGECVTGTSSWLAATRIARKRVAALENYVFVFIFPSKSSNKSSALRALHSSSIWPVVQSIRSPPPPTSL